MYTCLLYASLACLAIGVAWKLARLRLALAHLVTLAVCFGLTALICSVRSSAPDDVLVKFWLVVLVAAFSTLFGIALSKNVH